MIIVIIKFINNSFMVITMFQNKNFLLKSIGFALFAVFVVVAGCSDSKSNRLKANTPEAVKDTHAAMAAAVYSDSLEAAKTLQSAVTALLTQPTTENLEAAREAYKAIRAPYQQSEVLRWDTDITINSNTGAQGIASVDEWEGQVNAWPLAEGLIDYTAEDAENNIIAGDAAITVEYLISQNGLNDDEANVATGIHAIEFLLWGQDLNGTGAGAGNRTASDFDTQNCTGGNCDRRATYLQVVTDLLVSDLNEMFLEWGGNAKETPGTLAYNFINSDDALAYIIGSMKVMADDELASARMGTALMEQDPEEEHDCFSDLSHIAIYHNFQGIKNAFYGTYGDIEGSGIGDLINDADTSLYSKIDSMLMSIEGKMARILEIGEQNDPIRFDQIIGLGEGNVEFDNANAASLELVQLGIEFALARDALSLKELNIEGGGDGD